MTEAEQRILLHTVGLDRSPKAYRNFYLTGRGCTDFHAMRSLMEKGIMRQGRAAASWQGIQQMHYYHATDAGKAEAERLKLTQQSRPSCG